MNPLKSSLFQWMLNTVRQLEESSVSSLLKKVKLSNCPNLLTSNETGDKLVYNCIWGKYWGKTGNWCATAVNEDRTYNTWDWCPESCSHPGILVFCQLNLFSASCLCCDHLEPVVSLQLFLWWRRRDQGEGGDHPG